MPNALQLVKNDLQWSFRMASILNSRKYTTDTENGVFADAIEKETGIEFESLRRLMIWPQQKSHGREFLQITNLPGLSRDEGIVPSASGWKQFTRITKENEGSAICENSLKIVPAAFTLIVVFTLRTSYVKWID